ncbi:DNA-binding response regulator, NarL/FixJ family, contains REC and HTH domains [Actinomadura madurae]|uniref:DNA-binding response regulator, NarL/FixJ family, contains REC and HTH domains n=2 Tax=Thermomonosporaceae TaxID=2012 RepID=A0A1I5IEM6_9ACTN|nr:DNA-binding response regulator, NarL/FixJ family, contains REC and HTH domains [Actinomadura madurae]SPT57295.1 Response regulator uvrY [Actinomadura madurae]
MIRVELFDNMPIYANGLSVLLGQNGITVTGIHSDLQSVGSWLRADVLVMALPLAHEALTDSAFSLGAPPLLLVTDDALAVRSTPLAAYACGCVNREADGTSFVSAVRGAARGARFWEGAEVTEPAAPEPAQRLGSLSSREHQVLKLIARGFTHNQVATRLGISRHTVDTYVKRIRSKWALGNKADLTRAAMLALRS